MPADKDFKRLVRTRMQKTGEAYTTARARLLRKQQRPLTAEPTPDYGKLAGMSDAVIEKRTGFGWDHWVAELDRAGAHQWPHREIARLVHETYHVPDWWTQAVTVGYERIKGLRAIGQRRGGAYEASKSKVFPVPIARLYRAFQDTRTRRRWLGDVKFTIRTAIPEKSIRVTWPDGSSVELYFVNQGPGKTQLAVQHGKLPDKAAADRMKAYWTERLAALEAIVAKSKR
jgi:uncharacterized protein YndB with AHSA1/START domain